MRKPRESALEKTDLAHSVQLKFESGSGGAAFSRSTLVALPRVRVERYVGAVGKTLTGIMNVPEGFSTVVRNLGGTYLMRPQVGARVLVVPPQSAAFMRGPARVTIQAAKGEHLTEIVIWPSAFLLYLDAWVSEQRTPKTGEMRRAVACKPIQPNLVSSLNRLDHAYKAGDLSEPLLCSALYELVGRLLVGDDEFQLASVPDDLPATIMDLTKLVQQDPSQPWPLKDAADEAGYSPFHFSRVFKSLAGFGFHEFVDRSRTEMAINMLTASDDPIDVIAAKCGFGTTQGLRESVKEYLGLVPSELRTVPDSPVEF